MCICPACRSWRTSRKPTSKRLFRKLRSYQILIWQNLFFDVVSIWQKLKTFFYISISLLLLSWARHYTNFCFHSAWPTAAFNELRDYFSLALISVLRNSFQIIHFNCFASKNSHSSFLSFLMFSISSIDSLTLPIYISM